MVSFVSDYIIEASRVGVMYRFIDALFHTCDWRDDR